MAVDAFLRPPGQTIGTQRAQGEWGETKDTTVQDRDEKALVEQDPKCTNQILVYSLLSVSCSDQVMNDMIL